MAHPETEAVESYTVDSAANAISQIDGIFEEETEEAQAEPEQEEFTEGEQVAPEEASEEEPEETQEEELVEAIQAPVSWSQDKKEIFSKLPPEAQEYIHLRESERDKGFQEKATEIAELKKFTEAEQQRIEQERQAYVQTLDLLAQQSLPPKPDMALLNPQSPDYNPEQYHLLKAQHEQGLEYQQQLRQEQQRVAYEQQRVTDQKYSDYVKEQERILNETMPEWSKPETRRDIVEYATNEGYQPEQLARASAHDIKLLHKAMKYDKLMAEKPTVQQKVKTVPKVTKPGSVTSKNAKFEQQQAKSKRLRSTGRVEDAASVFMDFL